MKKNLVIGALILTAAGVITRILGFVFRIYMSNLIGSEGMGLYQLIIPLYMLAGTLSTSGISVAISKLIAEENAKKQLGNVKKILKASLFLTGTIGGMVGLFLFVNSGYIGTNFLKDPRTILSIRYLAPCIPFMALSSCLRGYFYGIQDVTKPAFAQVLEQFIRIGVVYVIIGYWIPKGLEYACAAAILGITAGEIISCAYVYFAYRASNKKLQTNKANISVISSIGSILTIAVPITASRTVSSILKMAENILIPIQLQLFGLSHHSALSTFGMLKGMVMPLLFFPSALLSSLAVTLVPAVSEANAVNGKRRIHHTVSKALKYTLLVGICMICIFMSFSYELGMAIYHDKEVGEMLRMLSFICPFMYIQLIVVGILNGLGEQMVPFINSLFDSLISLFFVFFCIPIFGFKAYLLGMAVSSIVVSILNLHKLLSITSIMFDYSNWLVKPILSAIATGLTIHYVGNAYIFPYISVGKGVTLAITALICIYFCCLFILNCITTEDVHWIAHAKKS